MGPVWGGNDFLWIRPKVYPCFLLTYGLGVGLGVGLVYGCTVSNSVKFFPDKRGLVGGDIYGFLWDQLGHRAYSCKRPDRPL